MISYIPLASWYLVTVGDDEMMTITKIKFGSCHQFTICGLVHVRQIRISISEICCVCTYKFIDCIHQT